MFSTLEYRQIDRSECQHGIEIAQITEVPKIQHGRQMRKLSTLLSGTLFSSALPFSTCSNVPNDSTSVFRNLRAGTRASNSMSISA